MVVPDIACVLTVHRPGAKRSEQVKIDLPLAVEKLVQTTLRSIIGEACVQSVW